MTGVSYEINYRGRASIRDLSHGAAIAGAFVPAPLEIPAHWQVEIAALVAENARLKQREIDLLNANSTLVEANRLLRGMKQTDAKSDFEWGSEIYLSGGRPVWLGNNCHLQYRTSRRSEWSYGEYHKWEKEDWLHVYSIRLSRDHGVYARLGDIDV